MGGRLELDLLPEIVPLTELELPEPQKGGGSIVLLILHLYNRNIESSESAQVCLS